MITKERDEIKIADSTSKTRKDVILVAGEDEVRRALIVKILSARGYKVEVLKETYNIFKRLEDAEYKIVIIDIIGYKKDPCLLLQKIRGESASSLIITLSDRNLINMYETKLGLLTNKLLVSPLDPKNLLDAVGEILLPGKRSDINTPLHPMIPPKKSPFSVETQIVELPLLGEIKSSHFTSSGEIKNANYSLSGDVTISDKKIIAIGGGKGGVGKSIITANLATGLAKAGKQVIVVDIDLGGPNLHTCFGIRKLPSGLFDFLLRDEVSLSDIAHPTKIPGLKIIGISEDYPDASNIKYQQKLRLIDGLKQLNAEYILLDLGSGTTLNVVDFFSIAGKGIVISSPGITSILNTYNFIKSVLYQKMEKYFRVKRKEKLCEIIRISAYPENEMKIKRISDLEKELIKIDPDAEEMISFVKKNFGVQLILNMVENTQDVKIGESIKNIGKKYLDIDIEYLGSIERDAAVEKSVISMTPFLLRFPSSAASFNIKSILSKIISNKELRAVGGLKKSNHELQ